LSDRGGRWLRASAGDELGTDRNQRILPPTATRNWGDAIKAQCPLSFPSFTRRFFPTGIRDGGRREPREQRSCSLGPRNTCRDLPAAGIPPQVQESPVRGSNGGALGCTTEGSNTHKTETREVRYAWHPWHQRRVLVRGARKRYGATVLQCTLEEHEFPVLELPEWMFDLSVCSYLNIAMAARVDCGSLRALKTLLESFVRADVQAVVEAQHHPFPSGGADARQTERNTDRAIQAAPPSSASSSGGQAEDDPSLGAITAAAPSKTRREHGCRGDES
jgi:hypothetical protein